MQNYDKTQSPQLSAYLALMGLFASGLVACRGLAQALDKPLPERVQIQDILLFGVATQWLSRTLTKDRVTAPLRAPFTTAGESEAKAAGHGEAPKGEGFRRALGQLLTCQYCSAPWVAAGLVNGLVLAPRTTRLLAAIGSTTAVADFLHCGYAWANRHVQQ